MQPHTSGKASNLLKSASEQNNCILILEVITSKHIVNIIRLPSFFPGPKICKIKKNNNNKEKISTSKYLYTYS